MATEEQSDTDEHRFGFLTRNQTKTDEPVAKLVHQLCAAVI